jgi:putative redox protein
MVEINITYEGGLHCKAVHGPSGAVVVTDAPVDNHGKGEGFSPTDLAAASLGVCLLTVMGIACQDRNIKMKGTTCRIEKHMSSDTPRRIIKIVADINFLKGIPFDKRGLLEAVALHCPVAKSLNQDMEVIMNFNFPD